MQITDNVRRQVECGIDFVTDGESSKPGFLTRVQERLEGFEAPRRSVDLASRQLWR